MILRMNVEVWNDSTQVRDASVITPHFATRIDPTPNVDALCEDLATGVSAWLPSLRQVRVRAYDAQSEPPNFPLGDAIRNIGTVPASNFPRELAVCLSYFGERNLPRQRGRLYLPITWLESTGSIGVRPSSAQRTKAGNLVPILTGLGGVDVDWIVWSPTTSSEKPASNWWVDDEWDVQRRRGLRATTRLEGTTTEASAP